MFGYYSVAILAFATSGIGLQFLFLDCLVDLVLVKGDGTEIDLLVLGQDEGLGVDVPPVAALVLHEITDQLAEVDLEVGLHKFSNVPDIGQGLFEVLIAGALHDIEGLGHLGVHYKFADFVDFLSRCVGIVRTEDPALVVAIAPPASPHHRSLDTMALHKPLNNAHLVPVAQHRRQNCFDFGSTDYLHIVACNPTIAVLSLPKPSFTFLRTATSSFSSAPSVSLVVMVW